MGKKGGGVILCVKKYLNNIFIKKGTKSESIFVKLNVPKKKPIFLGCAYRSPDLPFDQCADLIEEIAEIKDKFKKAHFWLAGDFNLPSIDWKTLKILENHQYPLPVNNLFIDMAQNLGLTQTVSEPTRGNNILDLFFTNTSSLTDKSVVVSGISDHEAVIVTNSLQLRHQKQPRRKVFLWNRANIPQMKTAANDFRTQFTDKYRQADANLDVNEMWSLIKSNLINILEANVPSKLTSSNSLPPWITQETKRLIRNKQSWYQKAKERNDDHS